MTARAALAVLALAAMLAGSGAQARDLAANPESVAQAPVRPRLDISLPGGFSEDRSDAARTALDRRFAGQAVVGQVGYLCGLDRYAPDSAERGGGPASGLGQRGTFLGASLGYAFP